tara:strand:- start:318 stop:749 length:432 start_codon:yes stop_codon:yes gene_type:complete
MSEIITDKLTGKTSAGDVTITSEGGSATMQLQQGVAKVWCNLDGTLATAASDLTGVRDSFNISAVVDNGTGDYTINITSAMSDANYAALVTCSRDDTVNGMGTIHGSSAAPTSSALRITGRIPTSAGAVDTAFSNASMHGDLA